MKDDSSFATESFSEGSAAGMTRSYSRQQSTAYSYTEPKTEDFESEIATESEGQYKRLIDMQASMTLLIIDMTRVCGDTSVGFYHYI